MKFSEVSCLNIFCVMKENFKKCTIFFSFLKRSVKESNSKTFLGRDIFKNVKSNYSIFKTKKNLKTHACRILDAFDIQKYETYFFRFLKICERKHVCQYKTSSFFPHYYRKSNFLCLLIVR